MSWQVQEAKQRFSELLRKAHDEGPQAVTRHGEEVAYVVDVAYFRRLTTEPKDFRAHLLDGPTIEGLDKILDEVRASHRRSSDDPFTEEASTTR